ncbi:unnamed protein product [Ectocarpus sp. 13 AM-2016]
MLVIYIGEREQQKGSFATETGPVCVCIIIICIDRATRLTDSACVSSLPLPSLGFRSLRVVLVLSPLLLLLWPPCLNHLSVPDPLPPKPDPVITCPHSLNSCVSIGRAGVYSGVVSRL